MAALNAVLPAGLEPQQPDRHHRRRAARAVRQGAGDRRRRPRGRRPARDPHAPGDDRSDGDGRGRCSSTRHIEGKPVLASWMGGADVEEGARILREAGIPTFAYPDTACVAVQPPVAVRREPALAVRDADAARGARARRVPGGRRRDHRRRRRRGPDAADRVRVQEGPGRLRHPDHGHRARDHRGRGGRRRGRHGLPGRRQAPVPDDHPQDRRRRRGAQPAARQTRSATRSAGSATR